MVITISNADFAASSHFRRASAILAATQLTPKQAFAMAVQALDQGFGGMEPDGKYKTEHLFLPSAWARMSDSIRRSVGICLSYLTATKLVPLVYVNRPGANNKLYAPAPGIDPAAYSFKVY